jgi:hypothetical protein
MATKPQAKAAIDAAVTAIKNGMDNILPAGVNIIDGNIGFAPTQWGIVVTAASFAEATTIETAIAANLTAAVQPYTISRQRRRGSGFLSIAFNTSGNVYKILYPET